MLDAMIHIHDMLNPFPVLCCQLEFLQSVYLWYIEGTPNDPASRNLHIQEATRLHRDDLTS
jgi:hypothetical protein